MIRAVATSESLIIRHRRGQRPLVVQNASKEARPYLHPLQAPDRLGEVTEDKPPHHPWQHGLYFGLNDVNGVGFWTEGLYEPNLATDGVVTTTSLQHEDVADRPPHWQVAATWSDRAGEPLLEDVQQWVLVDEGDRYWLDVAWRIRASRDVSFGQYAYGGMFLRMPFSDGSDACLLSSGGAVTPADAEAQRARWVAVSMSLIERAHLPVAQRHVSVAIMDHPTNPEHPVPWRVDGQFGVGPSRCIAGAWALRTGESEVFRHRVLVTLGKPDGRVIEPVYQAFAGAAR